MCLFRFWIWTICKSLKKLVNGGNLFFSHVLATIWLVIHLAASPVVAMAVRRIMDARWLMLRRLLGSASSVNPTSLWRSVMVAQTMGDSAQNVSGAMSMGSSVSLLLHTPWSLLPITSLLPSPAVRLPGFALFLSPEPARPCRRPGHVDRPAI